MRPLTGLSLCNVIGFELSKNYIENLYSPGAVKQGLKWGGVGKVGGGRRSLDGLKSCHQNGEPLNPAVHLETVEDVQPTGKRLNIRNAVRSANYTCVVTSHVASTSATAHLFVTGEWSKRG